MSLPKKIEDLIFTKSNETINPKTYKSVLEKYARSKEICDALSLEETTEIISYITKRDKKNIGDLSRHDTKLELLQQLEKNQTIYDLYFTLKQDTIQIR